MKCARCQDTVTHVVSVHYSATVPGAREMYASSTEPSRKAPIPFYLAGHDRPPWMTTVIDKSRSPKLEPIREIPSAVLW